MIITITFNPPFSRVGLMSVRNGIKDTSSNIPPRLTGLILPTRWSALSSQGELRYPVLSAECRHCLGLIPLSGLGKTGCWQHIVLECDCRILSMCSSQKRHLTPKSGSYLPRQMTCFRSCFILQILYKINRHANEMQRSERGSGEGAIIDTRSKANRQNLLEMKEVPTRLRAMERRLQEANELLQAQIAQKPDGASRERTGPQRSWASTRAH